MEVSIHTNNPGYDEKVKMILSRLETGTSREKLAQELGYTTYKSIDMYLRRKNFRWDSIRQNYVPNIPDPCENDFQPQSLPTSKVYSIISLFEKNSPYADPRAIAKLAGFKDHMEMAAYMRGKNYKWDSEKQNYISAANSSKTILEVENHVSPQQLSLGEYQKEHYSENNPSFSEDPIKRYTTLLELLEKHKDRLLTLILPESETATIPRYVVPGIYVTKSVHMSSNLDRLVREFSMEKNISQRDVFEVALINFFKQYGYRREVESLLSK